MDIFKKYKKEVTGIGMFLLYFIISDLLLAILLIFGLNLTSLSTNTKMIIKSIINLVFPIILIIVYRKDLFKDLKKIPKEYKNYLEVGITYYVIGLFGMIISNFIIQYIFGMSLAENESQVRNLIKAAPVFMFLSACIIAPFQEEMIFRKTFKDIFKNNNFFIIFSGFIFGSSHIVGNIYSWSDLLYIFPYGFLGAAFAYIYSKTNNIFVPITIHLIHNSVLVLLQISMLG